MFGFNVHRYKYFGQNYCLQLQDRKIPLYVLGLKAARASTLSVIIKETTRRRIPKDHNLYMHFDTLLVHFWFMYTGRISLPNWATNSLS